MMALIRYVIVLALFLHGLGHSMGFLEGWTTLPMGFVPRKPWLFGETVMYEGRLARIFGLIWLAALVGYMAAVYGVLDGREWWPVAAVVASVISLVAIVPWWNTVSPGARFGAVLFDLIIIATLSLPPWREPILQFFAG